MTTPRERSEAQAAAAAARRTELARLAGRTAVGSKPVRITFGLNPGLYRQLTAGCAARPVRRACPGPRIGAAARQDFSPELL